MKGGTMMSFWSPHIPPFLSLDHWTCNVLAKGVEVPFKAVGDVTAFLWLFVSSRPIKSLSVFPPLSSTFGATETSVRMMRMSSVTAVKMNSKKRRKKITTNKKKTPTIQSTPFQRRTASDSLDRRKKKQNDKHRLTLHLIDIASLQSWFLFCW